MATPFVEGRLMGKDLWVEIKTECGHCGRPMRVMLNHEMRYRMESKGAKPLVFSPQIDWSKFEEPNIIHAF
jgi:hypothetical protein